MVDVRVATVVPAVLIGAAAGTLAWAARDYRAWRALGPGGLSPTWRGWLRTTQLRTQAKDPIATDALLSRIGAPDDVSQLDDLSPRRGKRPRVGPHPVPHRQLTEHAPERVRASLRMAFDARVARNPDRLNYALSYFERHTEAVTLQEHCRHCADALITRGEIGHIHPSDGSMHMVLGPSDIRTVIEKQWGELHGLAGIALGLPATYTLIYAPRDESEVFVVARILDAAIAYVGQSAVERPA